MGTPRILTQRGGRLVGITVALLSAALACSSEPTTEAPARTEPPGLETPVDFVEQAESIDAAVDLLSRKLGIACAVLHPPPGPWQRLAASRPAAAADPGGTRPPERGRPEGESTRAAPSFDFQQRPLREVLHQVGDAFGCVWRDVGGVYAFRPGWELALSRAATAERAAAERRPLPSSRPILVELARLLPRGEGVDGARVPLAALSPEAQGVARQMLLAYLYTRMHEAGANLGPGLRAAAEPVPLSFPLFVSEGRTVAAPTPTGGRFAISYRMPGGASHTQCFTRTVHRADAPAPGP